MAAQSYAAIAQLHPNFSHAKLAGVVIWKNDSRGFPDRKNIGEERHTFGFTIRDSPDFFINVAAWGSEVYINGLTNSFSVGDCVTIDNPLITYKDPEKDDKYCPTTPSIFRLTVTEAHSRVLNCADMVVIERMLPLSHLPVKDPQDFYSLGDIVANGQTLDGTVINVLAAVRSIGELKQFTTSDGRRGQRMEAKLFDDSVSSFPLVLWDREAIQLVQTLSPKETVLFIADVKISFDSFRKAMVATVNCKTIITVNPDTREASLLFSYAQELSETGGLDEEEKPEDVPVESITDVYTVNQLKQKSLEESEPFFGVTYSFISKLDVDSSVSKVIRTRCTRCKFQASEDGQSCTNEMCPGREQGFSAAAVFDLLVDVSDHSGTLHGCIFRSPMVEKILDCTVEEFKNLTDDERTALKWRFLLERCKIYIKMLPPNKMRPATKGVILGFSLADPGEVKQRMSALL
ncbi:meiosis-specific with OB domain-containing protein [Periophthalmus magnuspinnatus]|uniref:meiosis-specific with OB domain-containing protein n=1 Tax=Periophthalmus magnuspinnatus TaxID=409849 RepID=UPI00145B2227|nr:meiosis-specific with OB domain-containing protein [Periophthalmus magnuspinnatus]